MTEAQIALAVSILSLLGQALNAWLKQRMRVDLLEMEQRIAEKIDGKYAPRETVEIEVQRLEERCDARCHRCA